MTRRVAALCWLALGASAWGQGVVVAPTPVPADARPELVAQTGLGSMVYDLAYSPDGLSLAAASWGVAVLWDLPTRAQRLALLGNQQQVNVVRFAPDGRRLMTVDMQGVGYLWDASTGRKLRSFDHLGFDYAFAFSPDSRSMVVGDALQSVADGTRLVTLQGPVGYRHAFSPDGESVAAATGTGEVVVWNTATGRRTLTLTGHGLPQGLTNRLGAPVYSADGRFVGAGARDGRVIVWDAATGRLRCSVVGSALLFNPNGQVFATNAGGNVSLWRTATGERILTRPGGAMAFSPDGQVLAVGYGDGAILRDGLTGAKLQTLEGAPWGAVCLAFSPDGRHVAAGCGGPAVAIWELADSARPRVFTNRTERLRGLAFSPDGRYLAQASEDQTAVLWDTTTGSPYRVLRRHQGGVTCVAYSPDGRWVASGSEDRSVILWDPAKGVERSRLSPGKRVGGVAFSPEATAVATWAGGDVSVWDPSTGSARQEWPEGRDQSPPFAGPLLSYSGDGKLLASLGAEQVDLREPGTEKRRALSTKGRYVSCLTLSADGRTLVTGGFDYTASLWDVATLAERHRYDWDVSEPDRPRSQRGYDDVHLTSVALSPDGRLLAAGGEDCNVVLWDTTSHQRLAVLRGHSGMIAGLAFSPDGLRLASAAWDGSVRLWDVRRRSFLAAFLSLAGGEHYLTATAAGYYTCSLGGAGAICWRLGSNLYPFDQFAEKFLRPDVVRRALAGEDISQVPALDGTQLPPNLGFVAPRYGSEVVGATVQVSLRAAGTHPIQRVELTVNGRPLPLELAQRLIVPHPDQAVRTFELAVPLPPNEPHLRLRAVAYDTESLRSRVAELAVSRPGATRSIGTLHVLAVGLNRYARLAAQYQLTYAVPDAQAVVAALRQLGGGRPYADVRSKLLTDQEATVTNLKFALRELKDNAGENDAAVVFISGHGVADRTGSFYFPAHEVDLDNPAGTGLSWQDFAAALREVRAKRVLVLADTCHSGGLVGDQALDGELVALRLNQVAHQMVFTAAARDETSVARAEWGHGAFTQALLEALRGQADQSPKDGKVSFRELRDYVMARTQALTGGRQHPQLPFLDNFDPEATLADVP